MPARRGGLRPVRRHSTRASQVRLRRSFAFIATVLAPSPFFFALLPYRGRLAGSFRKLSRTLPYNVGTLLGSFKLIGFAEYEKLSPVVTVPVLSISVDCPLMFFPS